MMQLSSSLLLCQSAVLLISFEGIVCPVQVFDFIIENFSYVDMYSRVVAETKNTTGRFIFKKSITGPSESGRHHVVRIPDILTHTLQQEPNCLKIVTFSVRGTTANYNIKFKSEIQAYQFANFKALHPATRFSWARIYYTWRPAIMAYERMEDGDIGFKVIDNGNYPDMDEHILNAPYLFKRSDMKREIKTTVPQTLYLRNLTTLEDYRIRFFSPKDLGTVLELFPQRVYDKFKTENYYYVPSTRENRPPRCLDTSGSHEPSGCDNTAELPEPEPSKSHDTSESHEPSESHDTSE